jgi:hypothetical protein
VVSFGGGFGGGRGFLCVAGSGRKKCDIFGCECVDGVGFCGFLCWGAVFVVVFNLGPFFPFLLRLLHLFLFI